MAELSIPDPVDRADLGVFVTRAVRLDSEALVRLRTAGSHLQAWVDTPFDALVTRSVRGGVRPGDLTIKATDLLAAMAAVGDTVVDPGEAQDARWRCALPPERGWRAVDQVPAEVLTDLVGQGAAVAKTHLGPRGGCVACSPYPAWASWVNPPRDKLSGCGPPTGGCGWMPATALCCGAGALHCHCSSDGFRRRGVSSAS
jgi:hypothetical protein